jgi:hypothetical protein
MHRREAMASLIQREHRPFQFWREERGFTYDPIGMHIWMWYGARASFLLIRAPHSPGTLGGDLVRFTRDIPAELYDQDLEIIGNTVRPLTSDEVLGLPSHETDEEYEPDANVAAALDALPVVEADPTRHVTKICISKSEIDNLLLHRGSPYIVQLEGRTSDGLLVLRRHGHDITLLWPRKISTIKDILISIITAVESLHEAGAVHRDLTPQNVLRGEDGSIVLCDLECDLSSSSCRAPELWVQNPTYNPQSDVYALGTLIWKLCYLNNPRWFVFYELFPVPAPFEDIYQACLRINPDHRPTLRQLRQSLINIPED